MASVVVADVVPLMRIGIATVLADAGHEVVATADSAREAVKRAVEHHPELAVIGSVNDLSVDEVARQLRAEVGVLRIVVLLSRAPRDTLADLLAVAVDGLVARSAAGEDLLRALARVAEGERYIDPVLVSGDAPDEDFEPLSLTGREREVLGLLAAGCSNREIASELFVSLPTVKTHLAHIYEKLQARNRNEALGKAMSLGLLA
jgi:DNA-binding NarL/FixJ family response regulator